MNTAITILWWIMLYLLLVNAVPIILFKTMRSWWIGILLGSMAFVFYAVQVVRIDPGSFDRFHIITAFLISVALFVVLDRWIDRLMEKALPSKGWFDEAIKFLFKHPKQGFVWAALVGPITEEILFRAMIQRELYVLGTLAAILISTVLFAALHLNLYQFVSGLISGLVLTVTYQKSGSLWLVIMIHMFYNSMSFVSEYKKQLHHPT